MNQHKRTENASLPFFIGSRMQFFTKRFVISRHFLTIVCILIQKRDTCGRERFAKLGGGRGVRYDIIGDRKIRDLRERAMAELGAIRRDDAAIRLLEHGRDDGHFRIIIGRKALRLTDPIHREDELIRVIISDLRDRIAAVRELILRIHRTADEDDVIVRVSRCLERDGDRVGDDIQIVIFLIYLTCHLLNLNLLQ